MFFYDPTAVIVDLSQTTIREVLRRAVRISANMYTCIYIPGSGNVWADLITRWLPPSLVRRMVSIPVLASSSSDDFLWPSLEKISKSQTKLAVLRSSEVLMAEDGLYKTYEGTLWIPDEPDSLHLCLWVIAHTGQSGHRSADTTKRVLTEHLT